MLHRFHTATLAQLESTRLVETRLATLAPLTSGDIEARWKQCRWPSAQLLLKKGVDGGRWERRWGGKGSRRWWWRRDVLGIVGTIIDIGAGAVGIES
jgi:hypothetical protein